MFKVKTVLLCLGLGLAAAYAPVVVKPQTPVVAKYVVRWRNPNPKGAVCRTEIYYGDGNFVTNSSSTNQIIFGIAGKMVKVIFFGTNGETAEGSNLVKLN